MSQKSIILITTIFLLLIAGMFIFAYINQQQKTSEIIIATTTPSVIEEVPYSYITQIDAKHYFIDGKHTLVGEVEMPTPCDLLEANAIVAESYPEQVTIDFKVINNADDCVQVITPYRFRVDFSASDKANIKGRFMGRDIILNLIPASAGEKPEDFEIFIKG